MQTIHSGESIAVTIAFQQYTTSVAVVPTTVSYSLYDEAGVAIESDVPVTIQTGDTSTTVRISSAHNTLSNGVLKALRAIELKMVDSGGVIYTNNAYYVVRASSELQVMVNSFQTYEEALLNAVDVPNLAVWDIKTRSTKVTAMIDAYEVLASYKYNIFATGPWPQNMVGPMFFDGYAVPAYGLTAEQFASMPAIVCNAIKKAQIAQADYLMNDMDIAKDRREGLLSHTIGEVSKMYRSGRPLIRPLCKSAISYVGPWIDTGLTVARG